MAIKIRKSDPEYIPEIICFESDKEFEDWAVAPYATIVGRTCKGDYSDAYKEAIRQGKELAIKDEDSKVYRRRRVCKHVIPDFHTPRETVLIELPIENLVPWSVASIRLKKLAKKQGNDE